MNPVNHNRLCCNRDIADHYGIEGRMSVSNSIRLKGEHNDHLSIDESPQVFMSVCTLKSLIQWM